MKNLNWKGLVLLVVLTGMLSTACKDDSTGPEDKTDNGENGGDAYVILPEHTKVLNDEALENMSSFSPLTGTITFSANDDQVNALNRGDIVVAGASEIAEEGFLRKISQINDGGNAVTVYTEPANFEDAIEEGVISIKHTLLSDDVDTTQLDDGIQLMKTADPAFLSFLLPDKPLVPGVKASGYVGFSIDIDFDFEVDNFQLEELSFLVNTTFESNLQFETTADYASLDEKYPLGTITFVPITIMVGPLPVVFVPELTLYVGVEGEISAGIETGVMQEVTSRSGIEYAGSWEKVEEYTSDFEFFTPELEDGCQIDGYLGPELSIKLYGIVGPYAYMRGYIALDASMVEQVPWWGLYGGFRLGLGVKVDVMGHSIVDYEPEEPVVEYRKTLMTGHGDVSHNWDLQVVERTPSGGRFTIDVAPDDVPYICYQKGVGDYKTLKLAWLDNDIWEFEGVDDVYYYSNALPKMQIDQTGDIHLCYLGQEGRQALLMYAKKTGGTWQFDTLNVWNAYNNLQLMVDAAGVPHVFATDIDYDQLYYFTKNSDAWVSEMVVDSVYYYEGSFSAALDRNGEPHVLFLHTSTFDWIHAYPEGSQWHMQVVDIPSRHTIMHTALQFDTGNNPVIAYSTYFDVDLFYMTYSGSAWTHDTIDDGGGVGAYVSMEIGSDAFPRMSYFDLTQDKLKYARWLGEGWGIETVDQTADVGRLSSMALDSQNHPHIVYYDATNGAVKYASWTGVPAKMRLSVSN